MRERERQGDSKSLSLGNWTHNTERADGMGRELVWGLT